MACNNCFPDWICKCVPYNDFIVINTNVPAGLYTFKITDKFDNVYEGLAERQDNGTLEIAISDFPEGFWGEFSGVKTLHIYEYGGCNPISIPLAMRYNCIEIETKGGNSEKNTIGCELL